MFVATDDEDVNARAYRDASGAHLMVNVADRPELCTFFLPSVLRRGKLSIAVSTEGASPLTARRLRRELEERIPAGFETYLDLLAAWRPRAIAALPDEPARLRFWQQATDGRVQRLVQAADEEAAERLLERAAGSRADRLRNPVETDLRSVQVSLHSCNEFRRL